MRATLAENQIRKQGFASTLNFLAKLHAPAIDVLALNGRMCENHLKLYIAVTIERLDYISIAH